MSRCHNFSAGPAALPESVLKTAAAEMTDWQGSGASVMEISHRGKAFMRVIEGAENDLRDLLHIPAEYRVLFLQGGATQQFSQIPFNLLAGRSADYIITGAWSKKAFLEAKKINANVRIAASTESSQFTRLPELTEIKLDPFAAYLHLCTNETIHGVEIAPERIADTSAPLVADMSSHILSSPIPIEKFGLIYAGAQKNIGPSGLTLVIIHRDLLGMAALNLPSVMDYAVQAENNSMLNTPPTFSIYIAGLVFKWLTSLGGLQAISEINAEKAKILYETLDDSDGFYKNHVMPDCRSKMNIPFFLPNKSLEADFLKESEKVGFVGLKGHQSLGGIRASLYNAVSIESVRALSLFMKNFAMKNHGK